MDVEHKGFVPQITVENVNLTYPNKSKPAVSDISLDISAGAFVAIVGASGAGKTTIIDVLLGVLIPDS